MLRSILLGLDGSEHGAAALDLSIRWAKRFDALLVGMGCVDEPGMHGPGEVAVGEAYFDRINADLLSETETKVEGILSRAARRCAEEGVAFKPLQDFGTPFVQILTEAQRFDLIVLGQQTHFQFGCEQESDVTLAKVMADSPRPVVAVPEKLGDGRSVVVAFDGSLQAARALYAFETSGLGQGCDVHVVSVAKEIKDSSRRADRAVEFLQTHGLVALADPVQSDQPPAEILQEMIRVHNPGLLVMGAYGQPVLREFFLGSAARTMLEKSKVPVFLYH